MIGSTNSTNQFSKTLCLTALAATAAASSVASAQIAANVCGLPPQVSIQVLTTDNTVLSVNSGGTVVGTKRIATIDGNLIGIDSRPSDGAAYLLYGVTDTGKIYRFVTAPNSPATPQLVSTLPLRFAGGFQALADFNPTLAPNANALRLIGSNDENFAILDANGVLGQVVAQNPVTYVQGDANFGVSPNLTAGAYDNNIVNLPFTTFYGIDYHFDTLVTIADRNSAGSSNTGGGLLKTLGPLVDSISFRPINFAPNAGLDIFTARSPAGPVTNFAVAVSGATLYCVDLKSFDDTLPPGTLQKVVARTVPIAFPVPNGTITGGLIDIALVPNGAVPQ